MLSFWEGELREFLCVSRITKKQFNNLLENLDEDITSSFSEKELSKLAGESGFVARVGGKITAKAFLGMIVFNSEELKKQSLADSVVELDVKYNIQVTKQSLNQRFNDAALSFLKSALQHLLNSELGSKSALKEVKGFNRILIKDSTCFGIDESMKDVFPVSDNEESDTAAIRIQFEYDVLSGKINDISINPYRDQDNQDWYNTNVYIQENDLIIRDLAYMHSKALIDTIEYRKANVLCRLDPRCNVFKSDGNGKYVKFNFSREQKKMRNSGLSWKDFTVFVGAKARVKLRMVIFDMPDDIANEKLRKVRRERKRNGSKCIRAETLIRARLTIMLTNVDSNKLSSSDLYSLYGLRWQIELIFKTWKSIAGIDKIKKVKIERFICYIYGRLLQVIMIWQLYWSANKYWYKQFGVRISLFKICKRLTKHLNFLYLVVCGIKQERQYALHKLTSLINHNMIVETKKGDRDYVEIIESTLETI